MEKIKQTSQMTPEEEKKSEEINYNAYPERKNIDKLRDGDYGSVDSVKELAKKENVFRNIFPKETIKESKTKRIDKEKAIKLYSAEAYRAIKAEKEKFTDALTGSSNRGAMNKIMPRILSLERRDGKDSSILMIDIDKFKDVNDKHGHGAGDFVLKEVVNTIKENIRKSDFTFRYGGEEFVIFLANTSMDQSQILAEKIRKSVEELEIPYKDKIINPTISIGCMSTSELDKWLTEDKKKEMKDIMDDLIDKADIAMYYSKKHINPKSGKDRNQTTIYTPEVDDWIKAEVIRKKLKKKK